MTPTTQLRINILSKIALYEKAYKQAIRFLNLEAETGSLVQLNSPLADSAKYYKEKIEELRKQLRET